jgi:hypothetical protein
MTSSRALKFVRAACGPRAEFSQLPDTYVGGVPENANGRPYLTVPLFGASPMGEYK